MSLPVIDAPKYYTELPSNGSKVQFRPFLVREQKQLLMAVNGDPEQQLQAVEDIIHACTFNKVNAEKLSAYDAEHLFLQIRARSVGENVDLVLTCQNCDEKHPHKLDLTEVKVVKPDNHTYTIDIGGDVLIKLKDPDLRAVDELKRNYTADGIIQLVARSIDSIWQGEELFASTDYSLGELVEFVENLSPVNLAKVEEFFDTLPILKHDIEYECKKCNSKNVAALEGLQRLFD
jgi:ribosomal protein L44E